MPKLPSRSWTLPTSALPDALGRVDRANRRAVRNGLTPYVVTTATADPEPVYAPQGTAIALTDKVFHRFDPDFGPTAYVVAAWRPMSTVTLIGEAPKLGDWQMVAILSREGSEDTVITRPVIGAPDDLDLTTFRGTVAVCDHCQLDRNRRDTYVVRHVVTGDLKQIGRRCLAVFVGIDTIPDWEPTFKLTDDLDGFAEFDAYDQTATDSDVLLVLELALGFVREFGWVPMRDAESGAPTAERIRAAISRRALPTGFADQRAELRAKATVILGWCREQSGSEYLNNLATLAAGTYVSHRSLPLLASAVAAYDRAVERTLREEANKLSAWQGTVGQRLTVEVTCEWITSRPGYRWDQTTSVCRLRDGDGNLFTWFASGAAPEVGDRIRLTGTVKDHQDYEGTRSTVLTRCRFVAAALASA